MPRKPPSRNLGLTLERVARRAGQQIDNAAVRMASGGPRPARASSGQSSVTNPKAADAATRKAFRDAMRNRRRSNA